ncbi:nucleotide-binding protein [Phycicoccus sp. 3266]|uniref:nucleotide-binding protein n=1 Tax=Phycicoccus sp. 3266 TaxID=2817751 RepID=UPI0028561991|nr:nucleotide-binding protein [Phycicoccus sp. 3266]MDR6862173.1 putative nucleotide-binding protein [Phycicoccus sp. 3266]
MQKKVKYPRAKFAPEVIEEAERLLGLPSPAPGTSTVAISGHEEWTFEDPSEFYAQYRKPCVHAAHQRSKSPLGLSIFYHLGYYTEVTVTASSRAAIEQTFAVFERHRDESTTPEPPPAPAALPEAPRVFIGHGRAPDWRDLKDHLHEQHLYAVEAYETGARTGHAVRDVLDTMLQRAAFAVLVLTAEDEMSDGQLRPRENVVHETGLFQGRLGWTRAIMLVEEGVEPFSNVAGIQQIRYPHGHVRSTFGDVLAALRREFGPGPFRQPASD